MNQEVTITGVYFKQKEELEAFPKQMEFAGKTYTFKNDGWRFLVQKGESVIKIFSVSDETADYRLKLDSNESRWTLLGVQPR